MSLGERAGFHGRGGPRKCGHHPSPEDIYFMTALPIYDAATLRLDGGHRDPADRAASLSFKALGVPAPLRAALASAGIETPFPIQAAALPDALAGLDILGRGRTGSGKTLGFAIPLVAGLAGGPTLACRPRGLVLVPTRELASQVHAVPPPLAPCLAPPVPPI